MFPQFDRRVCVFYFTRHNGKAANDALNRASNSSDSQEARKAQPIGFSSPTPFAA